MTVYDLTQGQPAKIEAGDILNCPYSGAVVPVKLPKGTYKLEVWGASGNYTMRSVTVTTNSAYYAGAYSCGTLTTNKKRSLYICVGETTFSKAKVSGEAWYRAFNGGGAKYGSSTDDNGAGGGATHISTMPHTVEEEATGHRLVASSDGLNSRLIVAGGGGCGRSTNAYMYAGYYPAKTTTESTSYYCGQMTKAGAIASTSTDIIGGFGYGSTNTSTADSNGAGGGGWYGGGAPSDSYGGGGSSYAWCEQYASYAPSGWLLTSEDYLTDVSMKCASDTMPSYSTDGTMTGNQMANGYARITVLDVQGLTLSVYKAGYKSAQSMWAKVDNSWKPMLGGWIYSSDSRAWYSFSGSGTVQLPNSVVFTANTAGSTVGLTNYGGNAPNLEYSIDGTTWNAWDYTPITLENAGGFVKIRGTNPNGFSSSTSVYSQFTMSGSISASGDVTYLMDKEGETHEIPEIYCFYKLFAGCTALTTAPTLSAMTLADECYGGMFQGCESLTTAPELPATTLTAGCYSNMFSGCTSLIEAPVLSAQAMADNCYYAMFEGCSSLLEMPDLTSTSLAGHCYAYMFKDCTSIVEASSLPATTLADSCYYRMFYGCTELKNIAPISATDIAYNACCSGMFYGCSKFTAITEDTGIPAFFTPATITGNNAVADMFYGTKGETADPVAGTNYYVQTVDYLTFTALVPNSTVYLANTSNTPNCMYSADNGQTWTAMPTTSATAVALADVGDKIILKGLNASGFSTSASKYSIFTMTGAIEASGNVMTLIDEVGETLTIPANYCFYKLFYNCVSLVYAPDLLANVLTQYCYNYTFSGCTSLRKPPVMPTEGATEGSGLTLQSYCFSYMFQNCVSMIEPPILNISTLATYSCQYMFSGCRFLKVESTAEGNTPFFTCPSSIPTSAVASMFASTGGTYTSNPTAGNTYYYVACDELEDNCLTFTANTAGSTVTFSPTSRLTLYIYCSVDGGYTWTQWSSGAKTLTNIGDTVQVRGKNSRMSSDTSSGHYSRFTGTGSLSASGNVMSLLDRLDPNHMLTTISMTSCFCYLFYGCPLTSAPELPATTLSTYCYAYMFQNRTSLATAPELPATTLANNCYSYMFSGCTSLTTPPSELPATTLASYCYQYMFNGCTSITTAPELPATTLASYCYQYMFQNCTSLVNIPSTLPATTLQTNCYYYMFNGCKALTYAPELPATTLLSYCYGYMFNGCSALKVNTQTGMPIFTYSTAVTNSVADMFTGTGGEFVGTPTVGNTYYCESNGDYLTFKANTANSTVGITNTNNTPNIEVSYNGGRSWETWDYSTITLSNAGSTVWMRGTNPDGFSKSMSNYSLFRVSGSVSASGDLMSLIDGTGETTVIPCNYCFHHLFQSCDLTSAPELSATTLTDGCYIGMFYGCGQLTSAPVLPATTLAYKCYSVMYGDCTALITPSAMYATTVAEECCDNMYMACTALTSVPDLPATTLATDCYSGMFTMCESLKTSPELPATTLAIGCYSGMFSYCTSLDTVGYIYATDLQAERCCRSMFLGCTALEVSDTGGSTLQEFFIPASITGTDAVRDMFKNTAGLTTDPVAGTTYYCKINGLVFTSVGTTSTVYLSNTSNTPNCEYSTDGNTWTAMPTASGSAVSIPAGQSIRVRGVNASGFSKSTSAYSKFVMTGTISASGNIMALIDGVGETTTIPCNYCFYYLFLNCTSLVSSPVLPATTLTSYCYNSMFSGCSALVTAPELPATALQTYCYQYMFNNCTALKSGPSILPATTLVSNCYEYMFYQCTSLTNAPELPATEMQSYCYANMFYGCKSLTTPPILPISTLSTRCCYTMFSGCSSLSVYNTSAEGTVLFFTCPSSSLSDPAYGMFSSTKGPYTSDPVAKGNYYFKYVNPIDHLKFASTGSSTIYLANTDNIPDCEYSYEGYYWYDMPTSSDTALTLTDGQYIYVRGNNPNGFSTSASNYSRFVMTGSVSASGNIMSLIDGVGNTTTIPSSYCFARLFNGCNVLTSAPALPATTMMERCYEAMFYGCGSLSETPELPATTLATYCCYQMFYNCTSLETIGYISATDLSYAGCMRDMFRGCSVLEVSTTGEGMQEFFAPTSITGTKAVNDMFTGTAGETANPVAGTAYYCPIGENYLTFTSVGATSTVYLINSSNTPDCEYSTDGNTWIAMPTASGSAVSIADGQSIKIRGNNPDGFSTSTSNYSYFMMPGSISASGSVMSLIDGKGKSTTIPVAYCFYHLFQGCTYLTTAPELPATTLTPYCYAEMFINCTSLTTAPELPATTLADYCYANMFIMCTILKVANTSASGYTHFFTCPSSIPTGAVSHMFTATGGSYTDDPVANGQYYYYQ